MWVASCMLATTSSVVAQLVDSYYNINEKVKLALLIVQAIGLGGYQANSIQFGIDQLHDSLCFSPVSCWKTHSSVHCSCLHSLYRSDVHYPPFLLANAFYCAPATPVDESHLDIKQENFDNILKQLCIAL